MKKSILHGLTLGLIILVNATFAFSANAQQKTSSPKVYAVINRADWCPVCQANGPRVMSEVMPACKTLSVAFIPNDLTDETTITKSTAQLQSKKIFDAVKDTKATGVILLIDAKTKKLIKKISVASSTNDIVKEIKEAQI